MNSKRLFYSDIDRIRRKRRTINNIKLCIGTLAGVAIGAIVSSSITRSECFNVEAVKVDILDNTNLLIATKLRNGSKHSLVFSAGDTKSIMEDLVMKFWPGD